MSPQRSFVDYLTAQREIREQFLRERDAFATVSRNFNYVIAGCYDELAIIYRLLGDMDAYRAMLDLSTRYGSWQERFHLSEDAIDSRDLLPGAAGNLSDLDEEIRFGCLLLDAGIMSTLAHKEPEKSRVLFASAEAHCTLSPEYVASRSDRHGLTMIAYSYLWKGYALLCLQRFDEAEKILFQVAPMYRALKLRSTHNPLVLAVIEMALTKVLVPLCVFKRAPIKKNLVRAQKGLENFIGVLYDNLYRLRGYTYYFHLKEQFEDVYSADPACFPDSIPRVDLIPQKPAMVYVRKENNWVGSVFIQDPEIVRRREYLCSNRDFGLFITYCRALETFPALASLVDVYALGQCTDPRPVAVECERLAATEGVDPQILRIAGKIGTYAREAERQNSALLLDYDPYKRPEPDMQYFPRPPVHTPDSLSAACSRPPSIPSWAHSITLEQTRRGRTIIGLHDADDPGIDIREYLEGSPEYRALTAPSTPLPEPHATQPGEQQTPRYRVGPENTRIMAFKQNVRRLLLLLDTLPFLSERHQQVKRYIDAAAFSRAYDALDEEELASDQEHLLVALGYRNLDREKVDALLRINAHAYFIKALLADLVPIDMIDTAKKIFFQQSLKSYSLPEVLFEYGMWCQRTYVNHEPEAGYQKILEDYRDYSPQIVVATMHNLAVTYLDGNDFEKAEDAFQEVLEYCRSHTASDTETYVPYIATTLSNMASLYAELKDYDRAERLSREALRHYQICAKNDSYKFLPAIAHETLKLAEILDTCGEEIAAPEEADTAIEIYLTLASNDPGRYLSGYADALLMKRVLLVKSLEHAKKFYHRGNVAEKIEKDIRDIDTIVQGL